MRWLWYPLAKMAFHVCLFFYVLKAKIKLEHIRRTGTAWEFHCYKREIINELQSIMDQKP